jgi:hypothetical protein
MKKSTVLMGVIFIVLAIISISASSEKIENIGGRHSSVKRHDNPGMNTPSGKLSIDFGKISLYFIPNNGQVNKKAVFYAKAAGYTLWLTKPGLVFDSLYLPHSPHSTNYRRDVSKLMFLGANKNPEIVPINKTTLRVNYFKGKDKSRWNTDIPTWSAVVYKNIYKNIDLKVYGTEKRVEYDWIVKPGGNPKDIRFQYKNVKGTRLDDQGNLLIETDSGELIHKKPVSYQEIGVGAGIRNCPSDKNKTLSDERRTAVSVTFKKIAKDSYGFAVEAYDKHRELIIDPVVLVYSTYLGGKMWDECYGIALDSSGYTYVAGGTWSMDFPLRDPYQPGPESENLDAFVIKIDTDRKGNSSLIYSTYLGGEDLEICCGIAVDNSGNVYVTGNTWSEDFPTRNSYQTYQGNEDAFVAKINTTRSGASSLIYSTYLGGEEPDSGQGIAVDGKGNIYVAGWTYSTDFPTRNPFQEESAEGFIDGFITKIDTTRSGNSSLVYSTYLGGEESEGCEDITVDSSGCAYVTGWTYSPDFPTQNAYQTHRGLSDCFVTKIDTTRSGTSSFIYSTCLGGGSSDYGKGIAVDVNNSGYTYVTGITRSWNFPTRNAWQKYQGGDDAFVVAIDTTRSGSPSLIYSTYLGGENDDGGSGIAVDGSSRNVYVTGYTESPDFPTLNPYQDYQGEKDTFVSKIDTTFSGTSSLIFSTFLGGEKSDGGNDIAVDNSGNVFVCGWTFSKNFPTLNQYQADPGDSDSDGYVIKFYLQPDEPPYIQLSRTGLDFSAVVGNGGTGTGTHTSAQSFSIRNSGGGSLNWTASTSHSWLMVEPENGTANGVVTVSVDPTGLSAGSYNGVITISDPDADNSPQTVNVTLRVYNPGSTVPPFGQFSTPVDGSLVSSSIPVTGWVLDDIGVENVKIFRGEGKSLVYIGDVVFVEGARPDIEAAYPGYPMNYKAGWGYMMLTNFLPNGGNGTFTIHAIATDLEGKQVTLGTKTIIVDNINAVKPFGALDTPIQGGMASGSSFINWGWALTPQPNTIPTDGSTLKVWVDGINIGFPTYNIYRADIAQLFPGYNNSNGAVGYFYLDTTAYSNGVHIIQWTATDDAGNTDGIGSRYFIVQNTGESRPKSTESHAGHIENRADSPWSPGFHGTPVKIVKGYNRNVKPQSIYPDENQDITIEIKELERLEIRLTPNTKHITQKNVSPGYFSGYMVIDRQLKPLPIGSLLDRERGVFYWQPGPGFIGCYRLVFAVKNQVDKESKINILVNIVPRFP